MGRDLPQLFLLVRGQICFHILDVAPHQVNAGGNYDIQVDDPGTAAFPFCPSLPIAVSGLRPIPVSHLLRRDDQ